MFASSIDKHKIINIKAIILKIACKRHVMTEKPAITDARTFQLPELVANRALVLLIIVAQLFVVVVMLVRFGIQFDGQHLVELTLYVQWQAICSALLLSALKKRIESLPKNAAASLSFLVLILVAIFVAVMASWYRQPQSMPSIDLVFVARAVLISAIVSGVALRYLFVQQALLQREKSALEARLVALQAKIKPHFLFNTLNSIASLINFAPDKAETMVEDLSDLLRASLQSDNIETSIEQEWHLCECYLAIEQQRLGERLHWQCDFQLDTQLPIPSLSLQPLIENAIYHGIQPATEPGFIAITGKLDNGWVEITIKNSQLGKAGAKHKGNKMALDNIRARLEHLYPENNTLKLDNKGDTFVATLRYKPAQGE